jgi:MEDS: MEthanogen/methylotroph, DcmR Sensory domain
MGDAMSETTVARPALRLKRGDHVCVFCRGRDERDELLLPFLAEGLSAGHKCLAVMDTSEPEEVVDALGATADGDGPADQLTVLASRDVYLTDRGFDMEGMLAFYGAELEQVASGAAAYPCIRTAGEMTWALRDIPGVADLLTYEARVNQVVADHPEAAISLCLYDVDRFDGELIVGVLRTHPTMVMSGTVVDNPFFIQPDEFLRQRS